MKNVILTIIGILIGVFGYIFIRDNYTKYPTGLVNPPAGIILETPVSGMNTQPHCISQDGEELSLESALIILNQSDFVENHKWDISFINPKCKVTSIVFEVKSKDGCFGSASINIKTREIENTKFSGCA